MSSRYQLFLFLVLCLCFPKPNIHAQDLNYTHYTVESGLLLPSNEVYGILFDKNDVLWATTDRGLWRYDGYTPRQFTVADGLKENTNFRIFTNSSGRVLVSSVNNYLCQIFGDSVTMHTSGSSLHAKCDSSEYIQQVTENSDGSIDVSFNRPGLVRFKPGSNPENLRRHRVNHNEASVAINYTPDSFYWDMIRIPDTSRSLKSTVTAENGWIYLTCGMTDPKRSYRKDLSPIGENEFLFGYSYKAFHIKNGKLIGEQMFSNEVLAVYADKSGDFWIGLEKEGALRYPKGDLKAVPQKYLQGESVSSIKKDHEGNFWFATTTNGIFQANTLEIAVFKNQSDDSKDNVITAMVSDGENVYLGTQSGLLFKSKESTYQQIISQQLSIPVTSGAIRKLFFTPEKHLIVYNNLLMEIDTAGHYRGIKKIDFYPFDYVRRPNGEWLASFTRIIIEIHRQKITGKWDKNTFLNSFPAESTISHAINRVRCMLLDTGGRLWMGSQNSGLISSDDSVVYPWVKTDTLLGKRTHDIVEAGENIWVSVADYGIAVIRPDSSIIRITQRDGLSSDIIDVLYAENDSIVWAGTNNGLNRISFNKDPGKSTSITYYTMREGLPSNRIFQIIKHKNNIWIGTTQGAIRLNPEFTKPLEVTPKLLPGPLEVNGNPLDLKDSLVLNPGGKNLVFKFRAITYRKPSTMRYQYKLVGVDRSYIVTYNHDARYRSLRYGNYVFCLNASYNGTFDPANEKTFHIQILQQWYETTLAWIFFSLLILLLLLLGFRLVLLAVKQRELEKRQLLDAEKRSLLSQMNPHFIFNSLNSIQHFIVQNDEFQANNYLTSFSGLIRRILENSKKSLITLQEEISTLSLYLTMEKLRFENEFEFKIEKDNHIDYFETMIPPMLLQPFVENAIWHGLLPLKSKGILNISFVGDGDFFQCQIRDNGIGREKSASAKKNKGLHVSTGIQNVQERIELLNKLNRRKIQLTITDLRDANGNAAGTLVEVVLPFDLKY